MVPKVVELFVQGKCCESGVQRPQARRRQQSAQWHDMVFLWRLLAQSRQRPPRLRQPGHLPQAGLEIRGRALDVAMLRQHLATCQSCRDVGRLPGDRRLRACEGEPMVIEVAQLQGACREQSRITVGRTNQRPRDRLHARRVIERAKPGDQVGKILVRALRCIRRRKDRLMRRTIAPTERFDV
ncbi:MAG TPA: hypothetical protein PKH66_07260 [Thermomonas sp.]|nr:hypothetical protein [Thermomonas sp.]